MNILLEQIDKEIELYDASVFFRLDSEWKALINWPNYYRWLWAAVRVIKPSLIVEIGRERGVSANIMLDSLGPDGRLVTIDINPECMFLQQEDDPRLQFITMDSILAYQYIPDKIDFLFIDGEHTREQVEQEWASYRGLMAKTSIIVMDDIHFNEGMTEFWDSIEEEKYDLSQWHEPGFGVIFIND